MPPLAPVVTPLPVTAPVPTGTPVADLAQPAGETDPGPFTYAVVTGAESVAVTAAQLTASTDLPAGDVPVSVTATSDPGGVSPETPATISVSPEESVDPPPVVDEYPNNPAIPAGLPSDPNQAWDYFLVAATHAIVPYARNGVDFVVARPSKTEPHANIHWDDTVLGPRPDAEIEDEAKRLASEWPAGVLTTPV